MHEVFNKTQLSCLSLDVQGHVQGVGFRPFVYRLAARHSLLGEIFNYRDGAGAFLEGAPEQLENFKNEFQKSIQLPIKIEKLSYKTIPSHGFSSLKIKKNTSPSVDRNSFSKIHTQPDAATCEYCWNDFFNPQSRYFGYPFISCAGCGPRWTITRKLPFERENTSYQNFSMCESCKSDYTDVGNRRFHAQTISCAKCGPQLSLIGRSPELDLTVQVSELLSNGAVGVVKGLGGYQLVADAENKAAIEKIRKLKSRPHQALSVMFKDFEIFKNCGGTEFKWQLLKTPAAPIICFEDIELTNSITIAPELFEIGCMAPTTALHYSIMPKSGLLIVTSCNKKGFPIAKNISEIPFKISEEIDFILDHNRLINFSVDDSVIRQKQVLRAARGLLPKLSILKNNSILDSTDILALGADIKNSAAVLYSDNLIELPYNGTLSDLTGTSRIKEQLSTQLSLFEFEPNVVLCDKHPDSLTTLINPHSQIIPVQVPHHLAHAYSVEHSDKRLILTFDGTGVNEAPEINGGEAYLVKNNSLKHVITLSKTTLVGGDSAVREPWKMLVSYLASSEVPISEIAVLMPDLSEEQISVVSELAKKPGTLKTTSLGRFFDAAASLIFFRSRTQTYEAQAPMLLEALATSFLKNKKISDEELLSLKFDSYDAREFLKSNNNSNSNPIEINVQKIMLHIYNRAKDESKLNTAQLAFEAHLLLAAVVAEAVSIIGPQDVVGTGGVFQNELFSKLLFRQLKKRGIEFFRPVDVCLNDQSIAKGQILSCLNQKESL